MVAYSHSGKSVVYTYDDGGDIHFGYVGSLLFGEKILRGGAGLYQIFSGTSKIKYITSYFDDPRDSKMISVGCALFELDVIFDTYYILNAVKYLRRYFR